MIGITPDYRFKAQDDDSFQGDRWEPEAADERELQADLQKRPRLKPKAVAGAHVGLG